MISFLLFCGKTGVSLDQMGYCQQKRFPCSHKGCGSVTFCPSSCGPLASVSLARPTVATVLPLLLQEQGQQGGSWELQPGC